jgi:hypothetical protein
MEFLMDGLLGPFAYYSTVVVFGMLVVAPLSMLAWRTRRVAAHTFKPVSIGWDLRSFAGLDRARLRMYRLHPASAGPQATREIRDETGKRVGRVSFYPYEPPRVEINGRDFRVFDQATPGAAALWRGKVGGSASDSIVLQENGKAIAEIFRHRSLLHSSFDGLSFARGNVAINTSRRSRKRPYEFVFGRRTVARVVRPDPTRIAGVAYAAIAANAYPEFAAGVLYLATRKR